MTVAVSPSIVDVGRLEADLRVLLGVEELGRLQVRDEVLVLDDDGVDRDGADELGAAVLVDGQLGVEPAKLPRNVASMCLTANAGGRVDAVVV